MTLGKIDLNSTIQEQEDLLFEEYKKFPWNVIEQVFQKKVAIAPEGKFLADEYNEIRENVVRRIKKKQEPVIFISKIDSAMKSFGEAAKVGIEDKKFELIKRMKYLQENGLDEFFIKYPKEKQYNSTKNYDDMLAKLEQELSPWGN